MTQARCRSGRRRAACAGAGFTLIELLAVMSILTVLMGLGIGFMLRRGSPLEQTMAMVTAKSRAAPTEVLVVKPDEGRTQLRVRGLEPVGAWHLEPGETQLNEQVRGDVHGDPAPGRFGVALRAKPDGKLPVLRVATLGRPMWDLQEGFLLRIDLYLDERRGATVAQLGRAFTLSLDAEATPELRLVLAAPGGQQGQSKTLKARHPLPMRRWVTLDVVHDGSEVRLVVDGRVVAADQARGAPLQREVDTFEVSLGQAPVPGLVDEIQLWAYLLGEPVELPVDVTVTGLDQGLRFLPTGETEHPSLISIKSGDLTETRRIAPGGVLQ
jgi:prepilin-type N-terminal cleavage/methylation domain-containing protein